MTYNRSSRGNTTAESLTALLRMKVDLTTTSEPKGLGRRPLPSKMGHLTSEQPIILAWESHSCHTASLSSLWLTRRRATETLETFSTQVQQRADCHMAQGGWPLAKWGTAGRAQTPEQLRKNSVRGWNVGRRPSKEAGLVPVSQPHFVELREYFHLPRITELPTLLYDS